MRDQKRTYLTTKSQKNKKILSPPPATIYAIPATKIHLIFRIKRAHPCNYRGTVFLKTCPARIRREPMFNLIGAGFEIRISDFSLPDNSLPNMML